MGQSEGHDKLAQQANLLARGGPSRAARGNLGTKEFGDANSIHWVARDVSHVEVGAIRHVVRHVGDTLGPRLPLRCTAPTARFLLERNDHGLTAS